MKKPWFGPRTFGVGFTPISWGGWVCVVLFVLVFTGLVASFF